MKTLKNTLRRKISESRGQALVEMALVLPLLLMLLWGVVEFGRIGHAYLVVTHAAREGARVGVVGASNDDIEEVVMQRAASLAEERLSLEITPSPEQRFAGDPLWVEVSYELPMTIPLWGMALPNPYPLESNAVMRLE